MYFYQHSKCTIRSITKTKSYFRCQFLIQSLKNGDFDKILMVTNIGQKNKLQISN